MRKPNLKGIVLGVLLAALVWIARRWLWQAALQLLWGMLAALLAFPLCKKLEKHMRPGMAAALSVLGMLAGILGVLGLLIPAFIRQGRELMNLLPALYASAEGWIQKWQGWMSHYGMETGLQQTLLQKGREAIGTAVPALAGRVGRLFENVGRWLLTPVFAFYFLRDRRQIGSWMYTLLPIRSRSVIVRILREMRRETAGYLRGQLMLCAFVGVLTAAGLLVCGVPAWLVLGAAMGILEMIPYAGPFIGGVMVVLFALPGGLSRALWATGVVVVVQQLEGTVLSPRLMSSATKLHPLSVILCVTAGSAAAGVTGVLLAVPLLLCIRAALRVYSLYATDWAEVEKVFSKR